MTQRLRIYTVPAALGPETLANVAITAGGYTVFNGSGGWCDIDNDHALVEETSATLEVIVEDQLVDHVITLVLLGARAIGETAILVTSEPILALTYNVANGRLVP